MNEALVHVIDDEVPIRNLVAAILGGAGLGVRTYASAPDFLEIAASVDAGCIVTDLRMAPMDGLELIERLKAQGVARPIIVVSGSGDIAVAVAAMKAGARDFLEKPLRGPLLIEAVRSALAADAQAARPGFVEPRFDGLLSVLSPREQLVLRGVVAGQVNKVIAHELGISPRTVEARRANMMLKTGATSLSALVRMALLSGL